MRKRKQEPHSEKQDARYRTESNRGGNIGVQCTGKKGIRIKSI